MAAGRFLSKTVSTDRELNRLSWPAQALYMMAVPHLDRDGLITGHPLLLMAQIAPLRAPDLVASMDGILAEWIDAELVVRYDSSGQPALWFPGFQKHQRLAASYSREAPSLFDPPPGCVRTADGLQEAAEAPAAPDPDQPVSNSGVTPDQLMTNSGVTPDQLMTNSGVTQPYKQQKDRSIKSQIPHETRSSSNKHARARPDPALPAAVAARGDVKPEIYALLTEFGVSEPARSEISRNGVTEAMVRGWIDYIGTQNLARPVGYLVKRLRSHDPPPESEPEEDPDSYEALKRRYVPADLADIITH